MSLPWSSKGSKGTPIGADELLILDSADANPATKNKRIAISTLPTTEITTWTANHDAAGFDLLNAGGITINNPADSFQYIVTSGAITADRILNLPVLTGTDTLIVQTLAQTLSNKTLNNTNEFEDDGLVIQNPTNTFNYLFQSAAIAANRTITFPLLLGNDTLVTEAFAQTLTNKTITAVGNTLTIASTDLTDTAVIVRTDQTNTFGDFAQTIPDNQLFIQNPAATFEYQIIADAIVADRTLTLPLLTGNDVIVTEAHTQTLTNKTIDGDLNTILDINETQMDVSVGGAGTVLTSNGVGLAPTYQASAGGAQTPWTSNIDAATFSLLNLGGLEINNPADTFQYIITSGAIAADRIANLPVLTGTDTFVFEAHTQTLTNKTLTTPTIADLTNAIHDHSNAVGGGNLTNTALTSGVFSAITGVGTQSQALDMGTTNKIVNLADPTTAQDGATKNYVDGFVQGSLKWKEPVTVASIGSNLTLAGEQTIDGILTSTSRILVKDQTLGQQNGIYVTAAGAWTRAVDFDEDDEILNGAMFVSEGTVNGDQAFVCTTDLPITVGTTVLAFVQFSGLGQITAGTNLSKSANTLNFDPTGGVDMLDNGLDMGTGIISFVSADTSIQDSGAGDLQLDVPTGDEIIMRVNNSSEYSFSSTRADFASNNITTTGKYLFGAGVDNFIQRSGSNNQYDVTTGGVHSFGVNGTPEYTFSATQADFNGNGILDAGTVTFAAGSAPASTVEAIWADVNGISLNVGTGDFYEFKINGGDIMTLQATELFLNFGSWRFGPTSLDVFENALNNVGLLNQKIDDATAIHEMEANHTTPANAQIVSQIDSIDDSSTGVRRTYGKIRTLIETPTNLAEDAEMFFSIMKAGTLTDYIALNEGNASQVVLHARLDMDVNDIEMGNATGIEWGGSGNRRIDNSTGGFGFRVETGDNFDYKINSVSEYTFNATTADFGANSLTNVSTISPNGQIAMATNQKITWGGSGNRSIENQSSGFIFEVETGDFFRFLNTNSTTLIELEANHTTPANGQIISQIDTKDDDSVGGSIIYSQIRTLIEDPTTTTADGEMFLSVLKGGTLTDYLSLNEANNGYLEPKIRMRFGWTGSSAGFEFSDTSGTNTYLMRGSAISGGREILLPLLASNDTFVFEGHAQTLDNKTLTNFVFLESSATNPAGVGAVRLGNTESIAWRNAGNTADLSLTVNASNEYEFTDPTVVLNGTGSQRELKFERPEILGDLTVIGSFEFSAFDGVSALEPYMQMQVLLEQDGAGTEEASIIQQFMQAGALTNAYTINFLQDGDFNLSLPLVLSGAPTLPTSSLAYLTVNAGGLIFNVPTGDEFDFTKNGATVLNFGDGNLNLNSQPMQGVVTITSDDVATASTGFLNMGNLEGVAWRNLGDTADFTLTVNASNELDYDGATFVMNGTGNARELKFERPEILADLTVIGQIDFAAFDGGSALDTYAQMQVLLEQDGIGTEEASILTQFMQAGGLTPAYTINFLQDGDFVLNLPLVLATSPTLPAGTLNYVSQDVNGVILNTLTGDDFSFKINGTDEYTFSATQADFNANDVLDMGALQFVATGTEPASTVNYIVATGSAGIIANVPTGDTFQIHVAGTLAWNFQSTTFFTNNNEIAFGTGKCRFTNIGTSIQADGSANLDIDVNTGLAVHMRVNDVTEHTFDSVGFITERRIEGKKGSDIASTDALTLLSGNYFDITGTTTINHIINTDWQAGSVVILQFDAAVTLTHSAGGATGAEADMFLAGAVNGAMTADDTITLVYDGVFWRETSRSVN